MALYKVTEEGAEKPRLIEAASERAALNHAVGTRFKIETVTSPIVAAEIVGSGVKVEKPGDPATESLPPNNADDKGGKDGDGEK